MSHTPPACIEVPGTPTPPRREDDQLSDTKDVDDLPTPALPAIEESELYHILSDTKTSTPTPSALGEDRIVWKLCSLNEPPTRAQDCENPHIEVDTVIDESLAPTPPVLEGCELSHIGGDTYFNESHIATPPALEGCEVSYIEGDTIVDESLASTQPVHQEYELPLIGGATIVDKPAKHIDFPPAPEVWDLDIHIRHYSSVGPYNIYLLHALH